MNLITYSTIYKSWLQIVIIHTNMQHDNIHLQLNSTRVKLVLFCYNKTKVISKLRTELLTNYTILCLVSILNRKEFSVLQRLGNRLDSNAEIRPPRTVIGEKGHYKTENEQRIIIILLHFNS